MKKCPYCNAENTEQAEVCKKCFAALPQNLSDNTKDISEKDKDNKANDGETLRVRNRKRSDN